MKEMLFQRTEDLRQLVRRAKVREPGAVLLLENQVAERMAAVLRPDDPRGGDGLDQVAQAIVPVMGDTHRESEPIDVLWDTLDELGPDVPDAGVDADTSRRVAKVVLNWRAEMPAPVRRQLRKHFRQAFAALRERDPAGHARFARLLQGDLGAVCAPIIPSVPQRDARGRASVLAPTEERPAGAPTRVSEEAREFMRWREILIAMLPREYRPGKQLVVPGGIACTDVLGPRLSWMVISGAGSTADALAFEAHLLNCDTCFDFHYRARWPLALLRREAARFAGPLHPAYRGPRSRAARGGWRGFLRSLRLSR